MSANAERGPSATKDDVESPSRRTGATARTQCAPAMGRIRSTARGIDQERNLPGGDGAHAAVDGAVAAPAAAGERIGGGFSTISGFSMTIQLWSLNRLVPVSRRALMGGTVADSAMRPMAVVSCIQRGSSAAIGRSAMTSIAVARRSLALRIERRLDEVPNLGAEPTRDECGQLIEALQHLGAGKGPAGEDAMMKAERGWPCSIATTDSAKIKDLVGTLDTSSDHQYRRPIAEASAALRAEPEVCRWSGPSAPGNLLMTASPNISRTHD